jgi:hypothetical protein
MQERWMDGEFWFAARSTRTGGYSVTYPLASISLIRTKCTSRCKSTFASGPMALASRSHVWNHAPWVIETWTGICQLLLSLSRGLIFGSQFITGAGKAPGSTNQKTMDINSWLCIDQEQTQGRDGQTGPRTKSSIGEKDDPNCRV